MLEMNDLARSWRLPVVDPGAWLRMQRSPPADSRGREPEGVFGAIIRPLPETALDLRHLVCDESEADDRLAASLGEGIQPGYFHLHRLQPLPYRDLYRRSSLSEGCVGRPGPAPDRLDPRALELVGDG